jgi:outer membrane lipoprotein-sorting protein
MTKNRPFTSLNTALTNFVFAMLVALPDARSDDQTLAQKLCSAYESIETVSCLIRKTTETPGTNIIMLSRVFYKKPDHIHVENVAPAKRRIIADGSKLYYHEEGVPRGFSRPIPELPPDWLVTLRNIPGTPMEHLLKLRNLKETAMPAEPDLPTRRSYQAERVFVILSCDAESRPTKIEFFKSSDMKEKVAQYTYSMFQKVSDNCSIPCLHKAVVSLPDGTQLTETRRIDNLEVNKPVAPNMFSADLFFKDIEFVPEFKNTYSK